MIISVNWLKEYTPINVPINELATLIGARLVEIEGVENLEEKFKDVLIVKVIECGPVEDSDHLNLTRIDDGGVVKDVERGEDGYIQVVCGAPNVRAGMFAAWLPPNSVVPETFGSSEPFVLGARKLRGYMSNGMLASAKELDLYEDHSGIVELAEATVGAQFASVYQLDDYLLDIENKSLTHRPDTFGLVGFAREVAAIQGMPFRTPDWLLNLTPEFANDSSIEVPVITIDNPELSSRYQAIVLTGADKARQSPMLLQTRLARSGVRPISAIVDVTNYLMLLSGQPLHAFDYDKLLAVGDGTVDIHVRGGKTGETLKLLDGRTIELDPTDIVIANGDTAIALAGAMGGADTEIDASTTRIIIESATFNLYNLRTTQMRHGIFSEAITRFTKGQPAALTAPVLAEAVKLLGQLTGAVAASPVGDSYPTKNTPVSIEITAGAVNEVLGSNYTTSELLATLQNVEFQVIETSETLTVTPPYWRADIHIIEDIFEELGRINSYDAIPAVLPTRTFTAVRPTSFDELRSKLRDLLVRAGASEVLTYSFVHGDVMKKAGQTPENAYRITNSISPDLQYYRQSLTPSLLTHVHPNIKNGYDQFALFELNKTHAKHDGLTEESVPVEHDSLALVIANKTNAKSAAYYNAKRYVEYVLSELGITAQYEPLTDGAASPLTQPFEEKRSARIVANGQVIGVVGEFKRSVAKNFKLTDNVAGFELSPRVLLELAQQVEYKASSRFPGTERDICFQVASDVTYGALIAAVNEATAQSAYEILLSPVDIYQGEGAETKNITVRFALSSFDKTLTGDDVSDAVNAVVKNVQEKTGAHVV